MMQFTRISVQNAAELLQTQPVALVDVRDSVSFSSAHIEGAFHLTNETLSAFVDITPQTTPVIVICYHGNSSQGVANYLTTLGYQTVYSVDGGFEDWRLHYPFTASL